uniref:RFTS domain-containing protein n=1 Tax=Arundo donax TaxID=35708 RepID=A0A0A9HAK8_ARUDO
MTTISRIARTPVCFSVLPFQFDDNYEFEEIDVANKVYLRGVGDNSLYLVLRKVVAWTAGLDCEQPNILVLSSEGNWIRLLKPRKCYKEEVARSILITV